MRKIYYAHHRKVMDETFEQLNDDLDKQALKRLSRMKFLFTLGFFFNVIALIFGLIVGNHYGFILVHSTIATFFGAEYYEIRKEERKRKVEMITRKLTK